MRIYFKDVKIFFHIFTYVHFLTSFAYYTSFEKDVILTEMANKKGYFLCNVTTNGKICNMEVERGKSGTNKGSFQFISKLIKVF